MIDSLELLCKVLMFFSFCLMTPEFLQPATRRRLAEYESLT